MQQYTQGHKELADTVQADWTPVQLNEYHRLYNHYVKVVRVCLYFCV